MTDPRIEKWADVLTGYCVDVQPGETVVISGGVAAESLLRALYAKVVERGGYPILSADISGLSAVLLDRGSDDQIAYITPMERFERTEANCSIHVLAETNTRNSSGVDPARSAASTKARSELRKIGMQRAGAGKYKWSLTIFPTNAYAQDAEMSTDAYTAFIMDACKLNEDDPVAAWIAMREVQAGIVD